MTEEAYKRFQAWVEDKEANPIYASVRGSVYRAALEKEPERTVKILKDEWFNTKSVDGKLVCLSALGLVKDPEIVEKSILTFNFNTAPAHDSVPSADMHALGAMLGANTVARPIQWKFLKENYDAAISKLGNPIVVDRYMNLSLSKFTSLEAVEDIEAFFKDKDTKSFDRTLETVKDKIRGRAAYKKRDSAALKEWLAANQYI